MSGSMAACVIYTRRVEVCLDGAGNSGSIDSDWAVEHNGRGIAAAGWIHANPAP